MRTPKTFYLCLLCLLIYFILEIKTETSKIVIHFKTVNSLHVNINNIFLWKITIFQTKTVSGKSKINLHFLISLMPSITETTGFFYLLLHLIRCNTFFWLKHMKRIGLHRDNVFGKELRNPLKGFGDSWHPQTMIWKPLQLRTFCCGCGFSACVSPSTLLRYRHNNYAR